MSTAPELITTSDELKRAAEAARAAGVVAIDTEFMREKTYRAQLCLLQLASPTDLWLVDPLVDVDLAPFGELIVDPEVEVVCHAGRQDFEILSDQLTVIPTRVFDVQVAAAFAGFGGSLPYGRLVENVISQKLHKGESYTDWCRRPLSRSQLSYAADDVRYLIPVAEHLKGRLEQQGRLEWAFEEMREMESPALYANDPREAWRRVSGRGSLSGKQVAVLQELAAWRDETASRRDLPRGWVVKDPTLVDLAKRAPTNRGQLSRVRGLVAKEAERSGDQILAAVQRGLEAPAIAMRQAPPRAVQARARMLSGLADALVRSRCEHAGLATELVTTRDELESLLVEVVTGELEPERHRLLNGWRKGFGGDAVIALAEGKIAVKATSGPPYIEEVPL